MSDDETKELLRELNDRIDGLASIFENARTSDDKLRSEMEDLRSEMEAVREEMMEVGLHLADVRDLLEDK